MTRSGIGYDSHRLIAGRRLIIGGVEIPSELGLDGHSDADVLTHAIIDALLGAAGLGDIGEHFPDTDERWRDADSIALLRSVIETLDGRGLAVVNVDCTLVMQSPRLAPHKQAIRMRLADALGVSPPGREREGDDRRGHRVRRAGRGRRRGRDRARPPGRLTGAGGRQARPPPPLLARVARRCER